MKFHFTLLLLTLMALIVLSHALTIDKRGEDEDEPDEDEPDENEGGPPPPIHHSPQQQQPKAKTVIEQVPKPTPPVVASPPTKYPPQEHHEEHSSPKKVKPETEASPKQVMPVLPSVQDETASPTIISPIFTYPATTSTDLLVPTLSTEIPTSSLTLPESTDLPPLGISSNADLSFFTPSSASIAAIALGSSMMVSFWL